MTPRHQIRAWPLLLALLAPPLCAGLGRQGARAEQPETQVQLDQRRLAHSAPVIEQIGPLAVPDTGRTKANADASAPSPTAAASLPDDMSDHLLGGLWGARHWMARQGIMLDVHEVDELWANTTGGSASAADGHNGSGTGPYYDGVTLVTLGLDLEKIIGLRGGLFNISALQTHGRSISQDHLVLFNPVSGYEADRSTRLFEMWYQQSFLDNTLDIKIGQQDLDTEFLISNYGALYLNANMGWPVAPSNNLYSGGPSWPLAAPAIRVRYRPSDSLSILLAASDDNPAGVRYNAFFVQHGGNTADPTSQTTLDGSGTLFNMNTGALLMAELQYAINPGPGRAGLPGIYKLGGYYDTADFPDYRYNTSGIPLGSARDTTSSPRMVAGNWLVYAVVDQMLWRPAPDSARSIGAFARVTGSGPSISTQISFAVDMGINFNAPFRSRLNDTLGLGWGLGEAASGLRQYDRNAHLPVQNTETYLELTYQAQLQPWCTLQPDFQYIFNPSGGVLDWSRHHTVQNEAIFGLRSSITF